MFLSDLAVLSLRLIEISVVDALMDNGLPKYC